MLIMLGSCSESGAEKQVRTELDSMREMAFDEAATEELTSFLSSNGKADFREFIEKAGKFEYSITGSEASPDDPEAILVTVRITTYCFGREYLRTWNDYLEKSADKDFDQAEFYNLMMQNLSAVTDKTFTREVKVSCKEEDGSWATNAAGNYELRDAILGGMLNEIASLAEINK